MGAWSADSKTHVSTMSDGDFRSNEQSVTMDADDDLRIEHVAADGTVTVLKASVPVLEPRSSSVSIVTDCSFERKSCSPIVAT